MTTKKANWSQKVANPLSLNNKTGYVGQSCVDFFKTYRLRIFDLHKAGMVYKLTPKSLDMYQSTGKLKLKA